MTREEQLACLIDRPCNACKFHNKGCSRWKCVFEEEPTDVKPLYKIDADGHIEEVNKIKEFYNKGWKDGAEATAYHVELCEEENQTISMSAIEDIKAEIGNNVEWHFKNHQEDIAQIYSDCLNIIDRYLGKEQE